MKKRSPVKLSRKTHLTIIVLLSVMFAGLVAWGYFVFRGEGSFAGSVHSVVKEGGCGGTASKSPVHPSDSGAPVPKKNAHRHSASHSSASRSGSCESSSGIGSLELPLIDDPRFVLRNRAGRYTLLYDTVYRQAVWVAYVLTGSEVRHKGTRRSHRFQVDLQVAERGWPTATDQDYAGSGFDRGHLLPSADRNDSPAENRATFLFSNVSPQYPNFNRKVWRHLEEQVRRWAERYDTLYVVTGGALHADLPLIHGRVGVPDYFYKTLLTHFNGTYHGIAFRIPHRPDPTCDYRSCLMSIDQLERYLNIDFYPHLPDSIEIRVEAEVDGRFWR